MHSHKNSLAHAQAYLHFNLRLSLTRLWRLSDRAFVAPPARENKTKQIDWKSKHTKENSKKRENQKAAKPRANSSPPERLEPAGALEMAT